MELIFGLNLLCGNLVDFLDGWLKICNGLGTADHHSFGERFGKLAGSTGKSLDDFFVLVSKTDAINIELIVLVNMLPV